MSERIRHRGIAIIVVIALHALMIDLLLRQPASLASMAGDGSVLRLRFWPREAPAIPFIPANSAPTRAPAVPADAASPTAPRPTTNKVPVSVQPPAGPASAADFLAQGAAWARTGDPVPDFGSNPLRQRRTRLPGGEQPGRFVMRRSVSPEQVVKFIGELFAGPGYDTDPCRRIRHNVDSLMTDLSDQGRERLGWELDEYAFRCMR